MFFFKHKAAYEMLISDWSSDVGSSDLTTADRCSCLISGSRRSRIGNRGHTVERHGRTLYVIFVRGRIGGRFLPHVLGALCGRVDTALHEPCDRFGARLEVSAHQAVQIVLDLPRRPPLSAQLEIELLLEPLRPLADHVIDAE